MIKRDKLNINYFTTGSGKNYRQAKELNKKSVSNFFNKLGYKVIEVNQWSRHAFGKIKKGNKIFFFKLASTEGISERTQNEVTWNNQISKAIKKHGVKFFAVPKVFKTGWFGENFYFISEFYGGPYLAYKNPVNTASLKKWLNKIVKINLFFLSLKGLKFLRDKNIKFSEIPNLVIKKTKKWYKEVEEHNLNKILEKVKEIKTTYQPSTNHGDFVPWQMIKQKNKFILIDGEHGSSKTPKYYDIAYFYQRLFTSGKSPKLAKLYLRKIKENLSKKEKGDFEKIFKPVLASRIIGGFWDAKNDGKKDLTYHNKIKKDFLRNNLY